MPKDAFPWMGRPFRAVFGALDAIAAKGVLFGAHRALLFVDPLGVHHPGRGSRLSKPGSRLCCGPLGHVLPGVFIHTGYLRGRGGYPVLSPPMGRANGRQRVAPGILAGKAVQGENSGRPTMTKGQDCGSTERASCPFLMSALLVCRDACRLPARPSHPQGQPGRDPPAPPVVWIGKGSLAQRQGPVYGKSRAEAARPFPYKRMPPIRYLCSFFL